MPQYMSSRDKFAFSVRVVKPEIGSFELRRDDNNYRKFDATKGDVVILVLNSSRRGEHMVFFRDHGVTSIPDFWLDTWTVPIT